MKQKFFKKFFLTTILIVLLSITFITVILSFFVSSYLTEEKRKMLSVNCHAVADAYGKIDQQDIDRMNTTDIFGALSNITEAEIFITDTSGKVILCSCDDWEVDGICMHNRKNVPSEIMKELETEDYYGNGDLDGLYDRALFTHATLLKDNSGEKIGAVFSTLSPTNIQIFYRKILQLFFFSALIPTIIMFFAEYAISYKFTKPLMLMTDASRSMAKGDFSKRIPVTSNDEIGELAVAFNQMTNSLVQNEGTRRSFIANVSHELKTPMTTIGGFIDGIIDETIPQEKQNYYLNIVSGEIKRLSKLVQSMLSLSKLELGEFQLNRSKFDISEMILNIVVSQEQRIGERKLQIIGLDTLKPTIVDADSDLIYQVIYNLVDNAVKFTDNGGKITFGVNENNLGVTFKIRNTGEGIEQKDLPLVFERFYKTDKSRSKVKDSTGLGLYIANTIIGVHNGKISVQSVKNKFTEFSFVLPKTDAIKEK